jgi:hypothetical protein
VMPSVGNVSLVEGIAVTPTAVTLTAVTPMVVN